MIEGGTPTIYVSNMDRAVEFYTEVLGLGLISRYGNEWASVDVGKGLTLGLHPAAERWVHQALWGPSTSVSM